MKRFNPRSHILYKSVYVPLLKWWSSRDGGQIRGHQGSVRWVPVTVKGATGGPWGRGVLCICTSGLFLTAAVESALISKIWCFKALIEWIKEGMLVGCSLKLSTELNLYEVTWEEALEGTGRTLPLLDAFPSPPQKKVRGEWGLTSYGFSGCVEKRKNHN